MAERSRPVLKVPSRVRLRLALGSAVMWIGALGAPRPSAALPDLTPTVPNYTVQFDTTVGSGDVAEGCAQSTTGVDLLRFTLVTSNVGSSDLALGDPRCPLPCSDHPGAICGNPDFECSPADGHNHPHFIDFLRYELLDSSGQQVLLGRKESFCLRDSVCAQPKYSCTNQGITVGCSDVYSANLGCQYLDVTNVPSGDYVLRVTVDPDNKIPESNENNNVVTLAVTIPPRANPTTTTPPTSSTTTTAPPSSTTTTSVPGSTSTTIVQSTTSTSLPGTTSTSSPAPTTTVTTTTVRGATTTTTVPPACVAGCTTVRASVASDGSQGDKPSLRAAMSSDGRFVAFESDATNLVAGDTNGLTDVFLRDRVGKTTVRVSVASSGGDANGSSEFPALSADGRFVAFVSNASNLVPNDTNGAPDVFVRDMATGTTTRVSVASDGTQGDDESFRPSISGDGGTVTFASNATTLVPNDTGAIDVFVHVMATGKTTRASLALNGTPGDDDSFNPVISADGRFVAFESRATNLVAGDTNGASDIFVRDLQKGTTVRVSVASDGTQANGDSFNASLSADGQQVAFESRADNLVEGDTNGASDVFVHDLGTGETVRASVASNGAPGDRGSFFPGLSPDGRFVAFTSDATTLVAGDTNGARDVFVHDRKTGATVRASLAHDGAQATKGSFGHAISAGGEFVAFESDAPNLVPGDTNSATDVFVRDLGAPASQCHTDADCDDGNLCTVDQCAAGQCQHADATGVAGIDCVIQLAISSPPCSPGSIRPKLARRVAHTLKRVRRLLDRAQHRSPARLDRARTRATHVLTRLEARLARAAKHARVSPACLRAVTGMLESLRARIDALRV